MKSKTKNMKNKKNKVYDKVGIIIRETRVKDKDIQGEQALKDLCLELADFFEKIDNGFDKKRFLKISNPNVHIQTNRN